MPDVIALREKRAFALDTLKALAAKAETEKRELSADESSTFDVGRKEVETLDREIRKAEFLADAERRAPAERLDGQGRGGPDLSGYSIAKAMQEALEGKLTGVEAEAHQELSRGKRSRGIMVRLRS